MLKLITQQILNISDLTDRCLQSYQGFKIEFWIFDENTVSNRQLLKHRQVTILQSIHIFKPGPIQL